MLRPPQRQHAAARAPRMHRPLFTLPWPAPLVAGTLVRRYDRFLADVTLASGETVAVHCVNSGSMEGFVRPGARVWLTPAPSPSRKLKWTWSLIELDGVTHGADTSLPNRIVKAMLEARALPRLRGWSTLTPEHVHAPGSRVDFHLTVRGRSHDIEVKNCHLVYPDGRAYFPDSVSERATKHLEILTRHAHQGDDATVLFVVQRVDATCVRPSDLHDPAFGRAARAAADAGVRFRALRVHATPEAVHVLGALPVDLAPYDTGPHAAWRAAMRPFTGWQRSKAPSRKA